ncbi:hypothetical protein D4764_06G0002870 [Takifugu flavidus]|uniref:DDE Tnp4 domain-containing protein n=1 Tax=Takifugu flavidus TaxID=433684 RepID=A0A5C6MZ85_9TELE|nr:hypothetical protein D4764_06G0002870 [Takifugu flavidus]
MGGGEQLSEFLRGTIVGCHMCNKSIREISTMLNLPRSTVVSVLLRWKREGSTVALPRSGRPHKLAEEGRQVLQGKAMESGRALPAEFKTASGAKNEHPSHYCVRNRHVLLLTMYTDGQADLRPDFRLSRSTVVKLIDVLRSPFDHGWGLEVEVLVFLFWLASAASYRVVSRGFSIPRSTVYDIVHRMSDKVLSLKNRTIKFPSLVDIPNIAAGFERLSGSPALQNVVGSIGGCHIRIKRPVADAHCYFNRKLFYSIQLQAVCDHQGLFIDIFTGYPGSVRDTQVLRNSPLYVQGLYPPEGYCIVGDGGYPCMSRPIALVTPYREPVTNMMVARMVTAWNPQKKHLGQMTLIKCSQTYNVESKLGTDWLQPCQRQPISHQLSKSMITFRTGQKHVGPGKSEADASHQAPRTVSELGQHIPADQVNQTKSRIPRTVREQVQPDLFFQPSED